MSPNQGIARHRHSVLTLVCGMDIEVWAVANGSRFAQDVRFQGFQRGLGGQLRIRAQNLAKVVMNRRRVIDDENTVTLDSGRGSGHVDPSGGANGSSRMNPAPQPGPSLSARNEPPSS